MAFSKAKMNNPSYLTDKKGSPHLIRFNTGVENATKPLTYCFQLFTTLGSHRVATQLNNYSKDAMFTDSARIGKAPWMKANGGILKDSIMITNGRYYHS